MALTVAEKIIKSHLVEGKMETGSEIAIAVDQALLQDATGTMAWLQFEAMQIPKIKTKFAIQYIDHNLLQEDNKNMDDHLFLQSVCSKNGVYVSKPGNGISHHVHTERFSKPGQIMIGADSHTPTCGGSGMIAIGAGGLDVAVAMATGRYYLKMPAVVGVKLTNQLKPWCTAMDVILEILKRIDVKGGVSKIFEFFGPGVKTLAVPERSTIGNMGAETGATCSIFPSDELTREYFKAQNREKDFVALEADKDAAYSDIIEIDLSKVEPLIACPYSPGNVKHIREVAGLEVFQAMIGSSTNSSYKNLMACAEAVKNKVAAKYTSFHVIPGSRQILETIARDNGLFSLLRSGARIAEPSCNACIGMGNAPAANTASIRSFPRNWKGRSGTEDDQVFLASPESCTAAALKGEVADPRDLGKYPEIRWPTSYVIDDNLIIAPDFSKKVIMGPNIKPLPTRGKMQNILQGEVLIIVNDNISTDHIMPAGAKILPFRSNIPEISKFVFVHMDPGFYQRAKEKNGGFIVGGENYGQGSSREHAALAPMYLGIKAVLAKSFARIHYSNLINFGILPLTFVNAADYDTIEQDDQLEIPDVIKTLQAKKEFTVFNKTKNKKYAMKLKLSDREIEIMVDGGLLNYTKQNYKA